MKLSVFGLRVDASINIGTGHVMRCMTLADALRAAGATCLFICREHPGNLISHIRQRGFAVSVLPAAAATLISDELAVVEKSNYAAWLGTDWATDAAQTQVVLGAMEVDWLIVDHYAIDARWEQTLRPLCRKVMVIDDLANRRHDCDLLLDQNLGRQISDYDGLVPDGCIRLIGPKFALLRPEFAALRDYSLGRRSPPVLKHLLISMGGIDRDNATGEILQALRECPLPEDGRISVVMGPHAPWLETIRQSAHSLPWRTEVVVNVSDMARLMADSDLAIGAAGSTAWERCCLGLPSVVVVLADNQTPGADALQQSGAVLRLEDPAAIPVEIPGIVALMATIESLQQKSEASLGIVDGLGVGRVIDALAATHA